MSEVEELEMRVRRLSQEDFSRFRDFFYQLENERWDQQIQMDLKAGKFEMLVEKARKEFNQGKAREL
jgi:hypothetical protein